MNPFSWLSGELRAWHFVVPAILAYAVPLGLYFESLAKSGGLPGASIGLLAAVFLVRDGFRLAARPLEYGSGFFALLLAALAILMLLQSATEKNPDFAYMSFVLAWFAAMWRFGAGALVRPLVPVWVLSLLFMPFVCAPLETFSLEVWNAALVPASHTLDYFLVPNDVAEQAIRLTQDRLLVIPNWVAKGFALNALSFCLGLSLLRGRAFFFAFFAMASNLIAVPVFFFCGLVMEGILTFHLGAAVSFWFIPLVVGCGVVAWNLVLQAFGGDDVNWVWKKQTDSDAEAESIFEGCDLDIGLFLVLLALVLAGLVTSCLLLIGFPGLGLF
jgi:hypothetical protein